MADEDGRIGASDGIHCAGALTTTNSAEDLCNTMLLALIDYICDPMVDRAQLRQALDCLSLAIQPQNLGAEAKRVFVFSVKRRGVVQIVVSLIERECSDVARAACDFLGDLAFNSDIGSQAVLEVFDRIICGLTRAFQAPVSVSPCLARAFVSLCANIVAACPASHARIIPLVRPVLLPIACDPSSSDRLLGSTILLLANLSVTIRHDLKALPVAGVLLDLVLDEHVPDCRKSVAESVIIFLMGHSRCQEIDRLIDVNVIQYYCLPILEHALRGTAFRGMYPHLVYSARLFQVLAQSRTYAEALLAQEDVVPTLLRACQRQEVHLETDHEGRRLALEALHSFATLGLWPPEPALAPGGNMAEVMSTLVLLLEDEQVEVRSAAAALWAILNKSHVRLLLGIGGRIEAAGQLPPQFWRTSVVSFLFPCVGDRPSGSASSVSASSVEHRVSGGEP